MSKKGLEGATVLVTGAASGIGKNIVGRLDRSLANVLATDVAEDVLARASQDEGWRAAHVATRPLDVRSENAWEDAFDAAEAAFGPVDVLIHAAGVIRPGRVHEMPSADVDFHIDVNVKGTLVGTRVAARRMVPRGKGHIVNFGSLASLAPVPGLALYAASKFAVRGFSLAAAEDLRPHGVAVTLIMPDAVATPMLDAQLPYEEAAMTFSGRKPLTADQVAEAVLEALETRPLEVVLPKGRGALAKFSSIVPGSARLFAPLLEKVGKRNQEKMRRSR